MLPTDAKERKNVPIATGVLDYFPDAIAYVALVSKRGGEQHHPGQPLHWDRSKSTDESDALLRHFLERGTIDSDGLRHSGKVAWRALALLQKEIEACNSEATAKVGAIKLVESAELIAAGISVYCTCPGGERGIYRYGGKPWRCSHCGKELANE